MTELVLTLCSSIVKAAFKLWVGNNALAEDLSADLTDMIRSRVSSALDQRKVRARFEKMEEIVADQLLSVLKAEFRNLDEGERNAAIIAVTETFDRARLTDKVLFAGDLDPYYLEKFLRRFTGLSTRDLSWDGTALYDRVLAQCCAYIIEIADKLPHFQAGAFAELLQRDSQILARLEEVLERLPAPAERDGSPGRVETAYRQRIAKIFDRLDLFGLDFAAQWYELSIAYVHLKISAKQESAHGDLKQATTNAETEKTARQGDANRAATKDDDSFENLLAVCPRLVIDGRAGSGKTTILQWIAVRAARQDFEGPASRLNGHVPFFIRLRDYSGGALPPPEEFLDKVAPLLAPAPGARPWPREQLESGNAFVLIDGVDEVSEAQRPEVVAWLRELTGLFPRARYVITTRPSAIEPDSLDEPEPGRPASGKRVERPRFVWAALDPMEPALIRAFVDQWHAAMREWQKDAESAEQLGICRDELIKILDHHRFLSELANTPLLAGLICALNQHLRGHLPQRRGEIFEKALTMFYQRDRMRGIVSGIPLDLEATNHLLSELALWMVRTSSIEVAADSAQDALHRSSRSLPNGPYDGSALYRHLLLRSGVLREPMQDNLDFVHRTFQEYLAALALAQTDHIGEVIKNADDDQWREVVILSAGQGNLRQTTDLLRGLLRPTWPGKARERRTLAVACLDEIRGADGDVLADIDRVIAGLVPPRSMNQAEALSHAGERLIPHLARVSTSLDLGQLLPTIRAATLIGGSDAFSLISDVAQRNKGKLKRAASPYRSAADEFVRAWQYFDPKLYAENVILPLGIREVRINDWRLLPAIAKARTITSVTLALFVRDGTDLSVLDNAQISSLTIEDSDLHSLVGILRRWSSVKNVTLRRCRQLENISPLSLLNNLERLDIVYCGRIPAEALMDIPSRVRCTRVN